MNCDTFLVKKDDFSQTQIDSQLAIEEQSLEKGEIVPPRLGWGLKFIINQELLGLGLAHGLGLGLKIRLRA